MSADETDGERNIHRHWRIVPANWQSRELVELFFTLDSTWHANWERPINGRRAVPGNRPRIRILKTGGRSEDGAAPSGLPRNCYSTAWLASVSSKVRADLEIVDEDYDFANGGRWW